MVVVVEIVFSTNYNCPSDTDDAATALSVRPLCIATESDTSLPSVRTTGKAHGAVTLSHLRATTSALAFLTA
jgi:hypothetical protein